MLLALSRLGSFSSRTHENSFDSRYAEMGLVEECRILVSCYPSFFSQAPQAKDLSVHGKTYPIKETDALQMIMGKLTTLQNNGSLEAHQKRLRENMKKAVDRPKPVSGLVKTTIERTWMFDPHIVVSQDMKTHTGELIQKAGTKINPLEVVSLRQPLAFINGDDSEQIKWAQTLKAKLGSLKVILVNGSLSLAREALNQKVYFDQNGLMVNKLKIQQVPALVTQKAAFLQIEEIKIS